MDRGCALGNTDGFGNRGFLNAIRHGGLSMTMDDGIGRLMDGHGLPAIAGVGGLFTMADGYILPLADGFGYRALNTDAAEKTVLHTVLLIVSLNADPIFTLR